jgi:hypothetical protein
VIADPESFLGRGLAGAVVVAETPNRSPSPTHSGAIGLSEMAMLFCERKLMTTRNREDQ